MFGPEFCDIETEPERNNTNVEGDITYCSVRYIMSK